MHDEHGGKDHVCMMYKVKNGRAHANSAAWLFRKTFAEGLFSYAGSSVWNNLPKTFAALTQSPFKATLKTHLSISKLFFTAASIPLPHTHEQVCVCF